MIMTAPWFVRAQLTDAIFCAVQIDPSDLSGEQPRDQQAHRLSTCGAIVRDSPSQIRQLDARRGQPRHLLDAAKIHDLELYDARHVAP
jgi:hypothetical protein